MCPLAGPWRAQAAVAYLDSLQARGLSLEAVEGRLRIPPGHCPAEVELVRLLKSELLAILEQDSRDLAEERAAILEHQAGFTRAEAERRVGMLTNAIPSPGEYHADLVGKSWYPGAA